MKQKNIDNAKIEVSEVEKIIGYTFKDKSLLLTALTHSSYSVFAKCESYEKLEFLGDSILGFVVAGYLFENRPNASEGEFTKARAAIVSGATLSAVVAKTGLSNFMLLGEAERRQNVQNNPSVCADIFEALVAAVYLDGGMDAAKDVVLGLLGDKLNKDKTTDLDFKTELNEYAGKKGLTVKYIQKNANAATENDDDARRFKFTVSVGGEDMGDGFGSTKKAAQQEAAKAALGKLKGN